MFEIEYATANVEQIFSNIDKIFYPEVQDYLKSCVEQLKRTGEIKFKIVPVKQPNVNGGIVWEVNHPSFRLTYSLDIENKKIKIWTFYIQAKYQKNEWLNYLENDPMLSEEPKPLYITQVDQPQKIIYGIKAVASGKTTNFELGSALGNTGKKRSIERHGLYFGRIATELNLLKTIKQGRSHVYALTESGQRLASSGNPDIEVRVLAEAMMTYEPIRVILGEIHEGTPFSIQLVQNLIDERLCPTDHTGVTSFRRAQALRTWTIWLSITMGIPIRYQGAEGKQLYIPYIYADSDL